MRDLADVVNLLTVVDKARQWPKLQPLHDAAMAALEKIVELPEKEKTKWQDQSSQSSAPTPASPKPLVRPVVESPKQET